MSSLFGKKIDIRKNKSFIWETNHNINFICNKIEGYIGNLFTLSENGFRDIVLIGLRSINQDKHDMGAEVYHRTGKTDIFIKDKEQVLYISEFKIWKGQNEIKDTFQQLFNYLTWNIKYSSIIFMNKNKNFNEVNQKIKKWLDAEVKKEKCKIFDEEENQWFIRYIDKRERKYNIYLACYDFYCEKK